MADDFTYDVFLSYSSKDKKIVRPLAERLRADGLRVWLDDWEIRPGDSIPAKVEEGLEHSRVLVLCMSEHAFGSGWAQLEAGTFRFRDPLNKERRFIPVRLDNSTIKGSLVQFLYINWLQEDRTQEYGKLLEVCRPSMKLMAEATTVEQSAERTIQLRSNVGIVTYAFSPDRKLVLTGCNDNVVRLWDVETSRCLRELKGHTRSVDSVIWSTDQRRALSGSNDGTVRLWDMETVLCTHTLPKNSESVLSMAWSDDQRHVLTSSGKSVWLWEVRAGSCLRLLEGHTDYVWSVAWSADQLRALSGAGDRTLRLWDLETGRCLRVLEGHTDAVYRVALSTDGRRALSGSWDKTVRLWDLETGRCLCVLEGHTDIVVSVAWSVDQRHALSGGNDRMLRLWDVEAGVCLCILKGHTGSVRSVEWSSDQRCALSGDHNGEIRLWDLSKFITYAHTPTALESSLSTAPAQVQYTNAKVLLV